MNGNERLYIIVLESIFSVILLLSFFLNKIFFDLIKIIGGGLILSLSLYIKTLLEKIMRIGLFYSMQFILTGIVNSFNIRGITIIIIFLLILIFTILIKETKKIVIYNSFNYKVTIVNKSNKVHLTGYLDTGNFSCYNNKPIIFINNKIKNKFFTQMLLENEKDTIIKTIDGYKSIKIYKIEYIYVQNKKYNNIYICFSNNIYAQCLLNVQMSL